MYMRETDHVKMCLYPWAHPSALPVGEYPGEEQCPGAPLRKFVGFNLSMHSAGVGHYYAGPGNLFWPLLYAAGLLPEPLMYTEDYHILEFGLGLTDLVRRPTRSSAELSPGEARAGVLQLPTKLVAYAPRVVSCCLSSNCLHGFIEPSYAGREDTENFERHRRIFQDNLSEVLRAQCQ